MSGTYDVIVVGAGAAGLTAAISAARKGASVLILEHMECAGKKLLATGNGKCNFTNQKQGVSCYRGSDPAFVLPVFRQFGLSDTLHFMEELGIEPRKKRDGYYYPASGQASSVVTLLLLECRRLKVQVRYQIGIRRIQREADHFLFDTKQGVFQSICCIIATGGKSAKKTGSDGSGLPYLSSFGHHVTKIVPALVQLQGKQSFLKEIAGIRAECCVMLYIEEKKAAEDTGELQLTEFGVSGIPVFQVSRYASYALSAGKPVFVLLNFLPRQNAKEVRMLLERRFYRYGTEKNAEQALIGLFPQKLIPVLLQEAGISREQKAMHCQEQELVKLCRLIRSLRVDICGTKGFEGAQVTAGGADTRELDPQTMESRLVPGLFLAGEVVDIDGMCGGYNLQWAWSSGWVAGASAAARRDKAIPQRGADVHSKSRPGREGVGRLPQRDTGGKESSPFSPKRDRKGQFYD